MKHGSILAVVSLLLLSAPLQARESHEIGPMLAGSILDIPRDGIGDEYFDNDDHGWIRLQSDREWRAIQEYDVQILAGHHVTAATISGRIFAGNPLDYGLRTFEFLLYEGDGVGKTFDFQRAATLVGSAQYHPPSEMHLYFSFDATDEVRALVDSGATHIGLRVQSTSMINPVNCLEPIQCSLAVDADPPDGSGPFCLGDGSTVDCPCLANGGPGEGCLTSSGQGGRLTGSGIADTGADTFVLEVAGGPAGRPGLLFQGTATAAPLPFGDGLRCVKPTLRHPVKVLSGAGTCSYSGLGADASSGETLSYQYWFRDPAGFCGGGFNVTGGWMVTWL